MKKVCDVLCAVVVISGVLIFLWLFAFLFRPVPVGLGRGNRLLFAVRLRISILSYSSTDVCYHAKNATKISDQGK